MFIRYSRCSVVTYASVSPRTNKMPCYWARRLNGRRLLRIPEFSKHQLTFLRDVEDLGIQDFSWSTGLSGLDLFQPFQLLYFIEYAIFRPSSWELFRNFLTSIFECLFHFRWKNIRRFISGFALTGIEASLQIETNAMKLDVEILRRASGARDPSLTEGFQASRRPYIVDTSTSSRKHR